jgi:hypothetical protein
MSFSHFLFKKKSPGVSANDILCLVIGYLAFILPGNILLRLLSPPIVLGGTAIIFGAILIGMAGAQNYATVLALRILLGSTQAFMQGISLYSSLWYKRDEIATRGGKSLATSSKVIVCN